MKPIFKNYEQDLLWRALNQTWEDSSLLQSIHILEIEQMNETTLTEITYNN